MRFLAVLFLVVALAGCGLFSKETKEDAVAIKADVAKIEAKITAAESDFPAVQILFSDLTSGDWFGAAIHLSAAIAAIEMIATPELLADFEQLAKDIRKYAKDAVAKQAAAEAQVRASGARMRAVARVAQAR